MAPFDRTRSYSSFIVNMYLSSAVTEIFSVEYWRELEIWDIIQAHWKWCR